MKEKSRISENQITFSEELSGSIDWMLLFIVAVLTAMGLIMQYSASGFDLTLVIKQGVFALVGFLAVFVMSRLSASFYMKISLPLFWGSLLITAATFFVGKDVNGAKRWIDFKVFTFQPSELLKVALILMISAYVCRHISWINNSPEIHLKEIWKNRKETDFKQIFYSKKEYLFMLGITATSVLAVALFNKDLGTAIIIFGIGYIMLMVISPRMNYLIVLICAAAAGIYILVKAVAYRTARIDAWLHFETTESELSYQIRQGLYAIGSGGWFGKGLGKSLQKDVLPESHTDMIFSMICEELGIIGGLIVIILFVLLVLRLKTIYDQTSELFGKMIIAGVTGHIALQAILNMAVMTNLLPNTGVPLPFISYGGTSLLCLLAEIGLVMSVRKTGIDRKNKNVYDKS